MNISYPMVSFSGECEFLEGCRMGGPRSLLDESMILKAVRDANAKVGITKWVLATISGIPSRLTCSKAATNGARINNHMNRK